MILRKQFSCLMMYLFYMLALVHTYSYQLAEANAYLGMNPWDLTIQGWLHLAAGTFLLVLIISRMKGKPSDFFILFYSLITITSFLCLSSVSGKINDSILFVSFIVLILPIVSIKIIEKFITKINFIGIVNPIIIDYLLGLILILSVLYAYFNAPPSAGFSMVDSYDRRLEGRDIYQTGALIAYAISISMNGILPYFAFKSGVNATMKLLLIAILTSVFFFWLLGTKAPILYVAMAYFIGILVKKKKIANFSMYLLLGIIGLYLIVLFEWIFFDDYSIIADYFFRRLFAVQAQLSGYFLDFIFVEKKSNWSWLIGALGNPLEITFYIGETYLNDATANANTNAFLYAFAAGGVLGYLLSIMFVSGLLVLFDRLYQSSRNPAYFYLAFIYGLLVVEQSFTTAFISSGVGLLFALIFFEKNIPIHKEIT